MYEVRDDNNVLISTHLMLTTAKLQVDILHKERGEHFAVYKVSQVWTSRTLSDIAVPVDL